ncbi:low temperature requirement protein A [Yinghuangia soli]|uniref:Low temperature requirement protein A n=1 Tax=Yinghuangia soli TaxID=2908204 RepID=A0AA41U070_9ACTN|nr:low temperature requirement protein A [Yinghuangia soli]MCF2529498.1 low temperature requirement protein A [Yinghuangia soli]
MTLSKSGPAEAVQSSERVSTLELFFDLVFVFTVTQLTAAIAHDLDLTGISRMVVMLAVIWWMYSGYVWLTNAVPPDTALRRCLLMVGMTGFLVVSLAIPHAFVDNDSATAFGWGYLVVTLVHTAMFAVSGASRAAIARIAPFNIGSAVLVVLGAFLTDLPQIAMWAAAATLQIVAPHLTDAMKFPLTARHFVERHGLVVVIALGESVIAIGAGAQLLDLDLTLIATAVLTIMLAFALWWAYFGTDDEAHTVARMEALPPRQRNLRALTVYGYGHYALLLGILLFSAGVKSAVAHPADRLDAAQACALAGGLALFLATNVATRLTFGISPNRYRVGAVLSLAATIPLGMLASALAEVAAIVAVLTVAGVMEEQRYPDPDPEAGAAGTGEPPAATGEVRRWRRG